MSFGYVCCACGRVFRADDYAKSGVLMERSGSAITRQRQILVPRC